MEKLNPKIAKRKAVKGSDFYYNPVQMKWN